MERKWVCREFADVKYASLDRLEEIVQEARAAEKAGTWKNFQIMVREVDDYGSTYLTAYMEGERLENDVEFTTRQKREAEYESIAAEYRRKQYENLKKEFGG